MTERYLVTGGVVEEITAETYAEVFEELRKLALAQPDMVIHALRFADPDLRVDSWPVAAMVFYERGGR
jgi:hypothetical protein